ncbi:MAG TPA: GPR1/FUN34/YaaH family transporter [Gaiellaceae bacterium]|nr:GPR1/FUN34/YaaH family transporter [Gaiellaceae bacterium]
MSTIDERRQHASAGVALREEEAWRDGFARPRVFLQPIAAPSALGLAGFSVATFMVAVIQAGWWGAWSDMPVIALFALTFGGIAQFAAGMWSYKARDVVATLAHGAWGAFWIAFGLLNIFILVGKLPAPAPGVSNTALGLWFFGLAYITFIPAVAAMGHNLAVSAVLWTLAAGSALSCAGWFMGGIGSGWLGAGGVLFVISAGLAAYVVTALCLTSVTKRTILPLFEYKKAANVPGRQPLEAVELPWAEPGIKQGQ